MLGNDLRSAMESRLRRAPTLKRHKESYSRASAFRSSVITQTTLPVRLFGRIRVVWKEFLAGLSLLSANPTSHCERRGHKKEWIVLKNDRLICRECGGSASL